MSKAWSNVTTSSSGSRIVRGVLAVDCFRWARMQEVGEVRNLKLEDCSKELRISGGRGAAFVEAAKSGDQSACSRSSARMPKACLFSGDPVKDKDDLQVFVAAYNQMHRWREIKAGGEMLYIGADNFPFPIPLGKNSSGQWYFDTAAGKDEILARRIGKGELTAIAACGAIADAEQQYFSQTHDGRKSQAVRSEIRQR